MQKILAECGFSHHEQLVLAFLLEHGAAPAALVARTTELKRPTAYLALQNLIAQGVVSKRRVGRVTLFTSLSRASLPDLLKSRARAKLQALDDAAERLRTTLSTLQPLPTTQLGGLSVEAIDTEHSLHRNMYESLLSGDYVGIFNPQLAINSRTKRYIVEFLRRTAESTPHIREIAVDGPLCRWYRQQIRNPNHHMRTLVPGSKYITDMILIQDSLILLDYSPLSRAAVKIQHHNLLVSFRALFDELWSRLGPGPG